MSDINVQGDRSTTGALYTSGLNVEPDDGVDSDLHTSAGVLNTDTIKPSSSNGTEASPSTQEVHLPKPAASASASSRPPERIAPDPKAVKALAAELYDTEFNLGLQHLTEKQRKLAILLHNDPTLPVDDPVIKETVAKAEKDALAKAKTVDFLPPDWTPPSEGDKPVKEYYDATVKNALESLKGDNDSTLLELAFYHPEFEASLTADQKTKLASLKALVKTELGFTPPPDLPLDSSTIDTQVALSFNSSFESALDKYVKDHDVSPKDAQLMTTLHYHPDASVNLSQELKAAMVDLEKDALKDFKTNNSLPANLPTGWPKTEADPQYDGIVRSNFRYLNEQNMSKYLEKHPEINKADLRAAIANIDAPGIADNVKDAAKAVLEQSKQAIREKYGFLPDLSGASTTWTGPPALLNSLTSLDDLLQAAQAHIDALPDSPAKVIYLNFLQVITRAVQTMQKEIFEMEQQRSGESKKISNAQLELSQAKREENQKAANDARAKQAEMDEKQKKANQTAAIMKIVTPIVIAIGIIATIASAGTLGVPATMMILALTALSIADQAGAKIGDKSLTRGCFDAAGDALGKIASWIPGVNPDLARFIGKMALIYLVIGLTTTNPGALLVAGQMFMMSGAAEDLIKGSAKANHGNDYEMDQKTLMISSTVVGGAVMLGAGIGAAACSGAAAANKAAMVEDLTNKILETSNKMQPLYGQMIEAQTAYEAGTMTLGECVKIHADVLKQLIPLLIKQAMLTLARAIISDPKGAMAILTTGLKIGTTGLGLANAIVEKQITDLRNDMNRGQADVNAKNIMWQKFIDNLKKLLQALLQMTTNDLAMIPQLSEMLQKALVSVDYSGV